MSFGNEREFIDHEQAKERREQAVKCPLLVSQIHQGGGIYDLREGDCLKEECAWWDKATDGCVIYRISVAVEPLWAVLNEIQNKMPHAGQFTK